MTDLNQEPLIIEQIKQANRSGDLGTPIRYWINQNLPLYLQRHCPADAADIVDLGCGSGLYAEMLRRLSLQGRPLNGRYLGLDLTPKPSWDHHTRQPSPLQCEFRAWDVHDLVSLGRTFNFALAITSFEHFTDDHRVIQQLAAVLRPGGRAVIVVPSKPTLFTYGFHGERRYSASDGRALAHSSGLRLLETVPFGGLPSYLAHLLWFNAAWMVAFPFRPLIKLGRRFQPHHPRWERLRLRLNNLQFAHLNTAPGRRLHAHLNRILSSADRALPFLPSAYLFTFIKDNA